MKYLKHINEDFSSEKSAILGEIENINKALLALQERTISEIKDIMLQIEEDYDFSIKQYSTNGSKIPNVETLAYVIAHIDSIDDDFVSALLKANRKLKDIGFKINVSIINFEGGTIEIIIDDNKILDDDKKVPIDLVKIVNGTEECSISIFFQEINPIEQKKPILFI